MLVVDLGLTVVYFSYVSVKRPGNLHSSGTALLVLFIRPCTARYLWLQRYFLTEYISRLRFLKLSLSLSFFSPKCLPLACQDEAE